MHTQRKVILRKPPKVMGQQANIQSKDSYIPDSSMAATTQTSQEAKKRDTPLPAKDYQVLSIQENNSSIYEEDYSQRDSYRKFNRPKELQDAQGLDLQLDKELHFIESSAVRTPHAIPDQQPL